MSIVRPYNTNFRYCCTDADGDVAYSNAAVLLPDQVVASCSWVPEFYSELLTYPAPPDASKALRVVNVGSGAQWDTAISNAAPGDLINITNSFTFATRWRRDDVIGTASNPICINGNGYTLSADPSWTSGGPIYMQNASWLYIYDLHFDGAESVTWGPAFGGQYGGQPADQIGTIDNVHIWGCEIENTLQQALILKRADNCSIIGNYIHDISAIVYDGTSQGGSGSMVYFGDAGSIPGACRDILVEKNHFERNHPNGVTRPLNVKLGCQRVTFRRNWCHNIRNRSNGLVTFFANSNTSQPPGDHLVEENIIHNTPNFESGGDCIVMGQTGIVRRNICFDFGKKGLRPALTFYGADKDLLFEDNTVFGYGNDTIAQPANYDTFGQNINQPPNLTQIGNVCDDNLGQYQATNSDFIGPTTGVADAGDGAGSGFEPSSITSIPDSFGALCSEPL